MKRLILIVALVLMTALPVFAAEGFDSIKPPYGAKLSDMEYGEYFVKYKEISGISYYNYLGPRIPNPIYEISSPRLSYGFVNGRLYSCIYQNSNVPRKKVVDLINSAYDQLPKTSYDEGDWSIFVWYDPKTDVDFKLKFNNKTMEVKSAFYYRPLKKYLTE